MGQANVPKTAAPTVTVRKPVLLEERFGRDSLRATWLGHACYLVEFPSGFRVLFDPVFTARCSPFSMLGPKRFTELPCEIEDIPIVDAVVIRWGPASIRPWPSCRADTSSAATITTTTSRIRRS